MCVCVLARAHTGTHTQVYTSIPIHICIYKGMSQRVCTTDIYVCVCIYVWARACVWLCRCTMYSCIMHVWEWMWLSWSWTVCWTLVNNNCSSTTASNICGCCRHRGTCRTAKWRGQDKRGGGLPATVRFRQIPCGLWGGGWGGRGASSPRVTWPDCQGRHRVVPHTHQTKECQNSSKKYFKMPPSQLLGCSNISKPVDAVSLFFSFWVIR